MQFQAGDTRNINGTTYQRQADGRWTPQGGSAPGGGRLVPLAPPDPFKVRDQELQEEAASRAREDQEFQRQKFEREIQLKDRQLAQSGANKAAEGAKAAAGFYERAANANRQYGEGVAPRGVIADAIADIAPQSVVNKFQSPERRQADAYAAEFVAATLRKESGAAISPAEFQSQYTRYFPQPGDDEGTIAAKAQLREQALESIRIQAGDLIPAPSAAPARLDDNAFQAELQRLVNSGATRDQIMAFMSAQGASEMVPGQVDAAVNAGGGTVLPPEQAEPGVWDQLRGATQNTIAGIGQGIAAIPDAAINAAGAVLAVPADALGFEGVADQLRNPVTIGGMIEQAVPTPQDRTSQGVRFASQIAGGVASLPQRATNALANAVVGSVPARPTANALASQGGRTVEAAQRQGVELLPADVGGRGVKAMTSAAAQAPVSAGTISGVSRRAADQMGNAASRAASQAGRVLPEDEAGEVVRKGGDLFVKQSKERASRFYDRANDMAKGVQVSAERAIAVIDDEIARKSQAGEMASDVLSELEKVKRSLSQAGGMSIVGIREARTILGAMARNDKLRGTDAKRVFGMVLDAASEDMAQALVQAGKGEAARLFRRADMLWKQRIAEIDEVLEPVIGKARSGEDIVKAVEGMARGNRGGVARLQRMLGALPPDERGDIAATVIDRMGRAKAGAQDEAGNVFSSETFLTNWNQMSQKGKSALFGNAEIRRNLDDIARIAAARRDTASLASRSNTPVGVVGNVSALALPGYVDPVAPFVLGALQYATGKLLASPAFTRWLARAPRNGKGLKAHVGRLGTVATQNPAIADDIARVQQQMMGIANDNYAPLAAESGDNQ